MNLAEIYFSSQAGFWKASRSTGSSLILIVVLGLVGFTLPASGGVILEGPGCYEVAGTYAGYKDGVIQLSVVEGTRSQHTVRIRWPEDPLFLPGMKLRFCVRSKEGGNPAELIFTPVGARPVTVLPFNADIYSNFWRRVLDVETQQVQPEITSATGATNRYVVTTRQ